MRKTLELTLDQLTACYNDQPNPIPGMDIIEHSIEIKNFAGDEVYELILVQGETLFKFRVTRFGTGVSNFAKGPYIGNEVTRREVVKVYYDEVI